MPAGRVRVSDMALCVRVSAKERKEEAGRTWRRHVHRQERDDLLSALGRLLPLAAKLLLDRDLEVAVVLLGQDLEVLEQRGGHVGFVAELVNHARDRVAPLLGRELQREVGEGDADLGEDDARARRELAQGREERVAEWEEVLFGELVQVVGDLAGRAPVSVCGPGLCERRSDCRRTFVRKVWAANSLGSTGASGANRMSCEVAHASFCVDGWAPELSVGT